MRSTRWLAIVLIVFPMTRATAQDTRSDATARAAVLGALEIGQRVRLDIARGRIEGLVVQVTARELTLTQDPAPRAIGVSEIERLWVQGRATKRGAAIGGIAGLFGGLVYGFLIGEIACAETDCGRGEVALVVGLVSGLGGAALGAGIGAALPAWHLRYP